ncbi:MAG: phosphatase [Spirochaetales bacterium]
MDDRVSMNIVIDTHTHSVASGHAYSTVDDLARAAFRKGLKGFVLTDHGPALPGGTHPYHFSNLRVLPEIIEGVRFYRGIEANILDTSGSLDLEAILLGRLDFVLAGLHEIAFPPGSQEKNTQVLLAALENPLLDAVSHPGNPTYPLEYEEVVKAAARLGKALEINNASFRIRKGSDENCLSIAKLCVKYGTLMVVGSDAHYHADVGKFDKALALIQAAGGSEELLINSSVERFEDFLERRKAIRRQYTSGLTGA